MDRRNPYQVNSFHVRSLHLGIPNSQPSVCTIHNAQNFVTMVTVVSIITTNYVVNILTCPT
jgi:hypothetical protein